MKDDHGATLIEFAIVSVLLITVLYGIMEFGLAFKDWLSISHASREGARIGAVAGNDSAADIAILRSVERALTASMMGDIVDVTIDDPDHMSETTTYRWDGTTPCRWTPCPDPDDLSYVPPNWLPSGRKIDTPTERIEVTVRFQHHWLTTMYNDGISNWTKAVIMRIEPQVFGS
ncbi:MAG: pilus assembly protein [Actinobacteria bacterium]|nr:pilus assembly protein [Actinomycetota bacterium]